MASVSLASARTTKESVGTRASARAAASAFPEHDAAAARRAAFGGDDEAAVRQRGDARERTGAEHRDRRRCVRLGVEVEHGPDDVATAVPRRERALTPRGQCRISTFAERLFGAIAAGPEHRVLAAPDGDRAAVARDAEPTAVHRAGIELPVRGARPD